MVLGVCKSLGVTPDYVIWEMSYENVLLYSHATPTYESEDDEGKKGSNDASGGFRYDLDANNPDNFKDGTEEEIITDLRTLF